MEIKGIDKFVELIIYSDNEINRFSINNNLITPINNKNFPKLGFINYIENVDNFNYIICTQKGLFIVKNLFENNSEPIKLLSRNKFSKINKPFWVQII